MREEELVIILPNTGESTAYETKRVCQELYPKAKVLSLYDKHRLGKGLILRIGTWIAKGEYIAFLDGDGDIHPKELKKLISLIDFYDVVVGNKIINGMSLSRRFISSVSRVFIQMVFGLEVATQTGIKLYRMNVIDDCRWKCDGYAFDIEILAKAVRRGYSIGQVTVNAKVERKVSLRTLFRTLFDSIIIYLRIRSEYGKNSAVVKKAY